MKKTRKSYNKEFKQKAKSDESKSSGDILSQLQSLHSDLSLHKGDHAQYLSLQSYTTDSSFPYICLSILVYSFARSITSSLCL